MDDTESVKAGAEASLRAALITRSGVEQAVRRGFYGNPEFSCILLGTALARRFGPAADIREITALTARIRADQPEDAVGFPAREAERVIRWMLGEAALGPGIDWGAVNYTEVFIAVLARILEEGRPGAAEVDDLFSEAREMAASVRDVAGDYLPGQQGSEARQSPGGPDLITLEAGTMVACGFQLLYQGHNDDALAAFDRAAAMKPDSYLASFGRAETLTCLERYEEAIAGYDKALLSRSPTAEAFNGKARALRLLGRYRDALREYDHAIELDPQCARAHAGRGAANDALGRNTQAIADFTTAISLEPGNEWAILSRADLYRRAGRYGEALADYDRLIRLDSSHAALFAARSQIYHALGREDDAIRDLQHAIELDPALAADDEDHV